jgi:hypothetical protein
LVTKLKPNINSVEVHPQLSNNGHPVDGVLVGAGSLWPWGTGLVEPITVSFHAVKFVGLA